MTNELKYYKTMIKPIEKKHNRLCMLYKIFKYEFIRKKRDKYNYLLIHYYQKLLNNKIAFENLQENFEKEFN